MSVNTEIIIPHTTEIVATIIFGLAIVHTFSVGFFAKLAHRNGPHSGLWHLFSEVEAVFGVWATLLLIYMAITSSPHNAVHYMETRDFTEPLFVFVIMIVAASRPILVFVTRIVLFVSHALPMELSLAKFFVIIFLVPLTGSFITEPAAMTLAALLLRDCFFSRNLPSRYKYIAIGTLFVNVSIGGVLTNFAAPPVLIVASKFGWTTTHMIEHFGWKSITAVLVNAGIATMVCRKAILKAFEEDSRHYMHRDDSMPWSVILVHLLFLTGVILNSHDPNVFIGILLLFVGYTQAYERYQNPLLIKEGLMVGFFLAGLIILGHLQQWWLQDLLAGLNPKVLYFGAAGLTAITDNAALTYLGSLVHVTQDQELWRYMLLAGAVTGGGLTVIANAPNPAGFSILKGCFPNESISPKGLFLGALSPTVVTIIFFLLPVLLFGFD